MIWSPLSLTAMRHRHPLPKNRNFGLFLCVVLLAIGALRGPLWTLGFLSGLCLAVSFVKPELFHSLNRAWQTLGFILGWLISPLVLALTYYLLVSPMAIVMKLFGHRALPPSGWSRKTKPCRFEKPF